MATKIQHYKPLARSFVYKGITMMRGVNTELEDIENMEIKEEDVWVCSFQRSGTTLTQELVYLVQTLDFERANNVNLDERFPIIEVIRNDMPFYGGLKMVEELPSPRFIKSHLHHFLLPEQLRSGKGKIIYTARNVRDCMWSLYKFYCYIGVIGDKSFTFEDFFELFMAAKVIYTPWTRHVREYWERRNDGNILFLKFEETVKDMAGTVKKIADFLNRKLTDEDIEKICDHCSLENMKNNKMVNMEYIKNHRQVNSEHGAHINRGVGGSWSDHFTDEMNKRIDEMLEKDLADTGLTFENS